ncbi:tetratricopeptide repeat protein [Empedobacter falsenii]
MDYNRLFNDIFFLIFDDEMDENQYPIWKSFSFIHNPIQQLIKAQDLLNQLLHEYPKDKKALFLKGVVQRNLNFNEESILYLLEAKKEDYYLYATNFYIAEYYIHKLKFEEAQKYLKEIEIVYPTNQRFLFLSILVSLELFEFEEAKRYLNILYQLVEDKQVLELLSKNLQITEEIVLKTTNRLVLKNFKLRSFNYNLQLKTNLIAFYKNFADIGVNFNGINCFIMALTLKQITLYPTFHNLELYNVQTILDYIDVDKKSVQMRLEDIDFDHDFVKNYHEYLEVEILLKED